MSLPGRYSSDTIDKAQDLIDNEEIDRDADHGDVFWARGSTGNVYRVQVFSGDDGLMVTCGCPNGSKKGGEPNCYHSAAALLLAGGDDPRM